MDIFFGTLFVIICILLIIVVLLQKGRGGGLGAAFGGMAGSAFGTRVGDVFTWVTIVLAGLFLLLAIGATMAYRPPAGQVGKLSFNPPPGPIEERTPISIKCGTKGSTIHYTLDGTTPTEKSTRYDSAVHIDPGTVIRTRAFFRNWEPSPVAVGKYPAGGPASRPTSAPVPASAPAGGTD